MKFTLTLGAALWIAPFWAIGAQAHDAITGWEFPAACCSPGMDCREIPIRDIEITKAGYKLPSGETVKFSEANTSPDGRYYACLRNDGSLRSSWKDYPVLNRSWRCFFAPDGAI